ncbi:MAG: TldD/PmbA family protein [Alphaproteobacteria bacterium]|jgi:PmbA protein|nr:TldD/PmbA family protein [Alphaproteobacteria bacterium]
MTATRPSHEALLGHALELAAKGGADSADAVLLEGTSLSASCRLGNPEDLERSEGQDMGLRVFIGQQQASVSSSDISQSAVAELVERALAMARAVPEDPYCGLADQTRLASNWRDLDLVDEIEPDARDLLDMAREAEDAARAVDGVTNSEGGTAGYGMTRALLATSHGFVGGYAATRHSVSASVLAGTGTEMERDYDYSSTCHKADLDAAADIGRRAGERTVRRLGPRKINSGQVPIVYDPRASGGLLRHLSGAISGSAIARGTSYLMESLDKAVFSPAVTILDDPHRVRGLRSRPFDGEGVATKPREIIAGGVLTTWLLDSRAARQLGSQTTGHASRGTSGPPSPAPTNLYMQAGTISPDDLMADIATGFYVTELIGMGVNGVTGDYSRGASGFMIENGKLGEPVSEVTIAGNLKDMFLGLTPADDLVFHYGIDAPTVRVDGMTVAGQ